MEHAPTRRRDGLRRGGRLPVLRPGDRSRASGPVLPRRRRLLERGDLPIRRRLPVRFGDGAEPAFGPRTYTIPHRGQVNAGAALGWIYANFEEPQ